VVGVSYTNSDVVGDFGAFRSTGAGHTFGANYTHYLPPAGPRRTYVLAGIDDKLFKAARINDLVVPGTFDRRSRPLTVGYYAKVETDAALWGYNLNLAANTATGSHNDLASYRSEDPRITTAHWKALRGGFSWLAPFAGGWLVSARTDVQYSPDVLISGEQFGLGGTGSVRGTTIERPLSADKGVFGSLEVSTPELVPGLRALGFLDAGWLGHNAPNAGTKPRSDSLASLGAGLRYARGAVALSAEYGRLLSSSKVPLAVNSAAPQSGDDKLYVNLSIRF
jgi:hemolysin activation/secretion protein